MRIVLYLNFNFELLRNRSSLRFRPFVRRYNGPHVYCLSGTWYRLHGGIKLQLSEIKPVNLAISPFLSRNLKKILGILRLALVGACASCPSSIVTLKSGVENMMKFYIPEISEVQQVTTEEEKKSQDVFNEFNKKLDDWYQIGLFFL